MEYAIIGNLFVRPNRLQRGQKLDGHTHNFHHGTFARVGWFLVRGRLPNGAEKVVQIASAEYSELRRLYAAYEPEKIKRPIRFPDVPGQDSKLPEFDIRFIGVGEPVPEGGEEILFEPVNYVAEIRADVKHEIFALSDGTVDCTYAHRDAQGQVVQEFNRMMGSYV